MKKTIYAYSTQDAENLIVEKIIPYTYPITGWRDQLIAYGDEKFKYDVLGNPTTYRNNDLKWSHGRQLDKYNNIEFTYNADGVRTSKIVNGVETQFISDGSKLLAQNNGNFLMFHYGSEGVIGFTYQGVGEYYYKKNILGDIIAIIDQNGVEIVKYVYDAWGNHKTFVLNDKQYVDISTHLSYTQDGLNNKSISELNPFRYRGYYYDSETKLYYLNSRYYDPETGRFINADDIGVLSKTTNVFNGLNLYSYCFNNPVSAIDEDGNIPNWLKWLIGGILIVVGVIVSVATAGAGTPFLVALGSALLHTAIQVGISMAVSVGVTGVINVANNKNFFDNIGDTLADGFMWGGIFAGSAQILSGGFKVTANVMSSHGLTVGAKSGINIGKTGIKILSPNSLKHFKEVGGTLIKFGKYARIDVGTKFGLHLHTMITSAKWLPSLIKHFPIGAIIGGLIGGTR